jgi:4-hydroxy-tetrahydrodipicolinate synthase
MALGRRDLRGIFPAFPTATDASGEVNAAGHTKLVKYMLDGGVSGLVPIGGTGEFTALSPRDRRKVVEVTVAGAGGKVPVIPGILSPGFAEAVAAGREFAAAGATALMLIVPFYVTPTQIGIRDYFRAFRDKIDLPILLYDIPYRTRIVTEPETIAGLAEEGAIIGMKACNTDIAHFSRILALAGDKLAVLSGEDSLFPVQVAMGASGGVLATASMIPRFWVEVNELARRDKLTEALVRHRQVLPLLDVVFAEANPGPLKEALNLMGLDVGHALLPLKTPSETTLNKLRQVMSELRSLGILRLQSAAA